MHPVLFHIGPIPIFSYGVFVLLGTALLFAMALGLGRHYGRSWEQLWPVAIGAFVGALLVARLSHLIVEPDRFEEFANFYALLRPGTPGTSSRSWTWTLPASGSSQGIRRNSSTAAPQRCANFVMCEKLSEDGSNRSCTQRMLVSAIVHLISRQPSSSPRTTGKRSAKARSLGV